MFSVCVVCSGIKVVKENVVGAENEGTQSVETGQEIETETESVLVEGIR